MAIGKTGRSISTRERSAAAPKKPDVKPIRKAPAIKIKYKTSVTKRSNVDDNFLSKRTTNVDENPLAKRTTTTSNLDNNFLANKLEALKQDIDDLKPQRKRQRRSTLVEPTVASYRSPSPTLDDSVLTNKENLSIVERAPTLKRSHSQAFNQTINTTTELCNAMQNKWTYKQFSENEQLLKDRLEQAERENEQLRAKLQQCETTFHLELGEQKIKFEKILERAAEDSRRIKELTNIIQELKGNIRVFVRVRPLLQGIENEDATSCIDCLKDDQLLLKNKINTKFEFEKVFGPNDTQSVVFNEIKPLATSLLDGFNVCIFAYGQTGSGKTHTMEGPADDPGVNYKILEEIFANVADRRDLFTYELNVGVLEVYNENLVDLLSDDKKKKIDVSITPTGVSVPNLTLTTVTDYQTTVGVIRKGLRSRNVGKNNLNEASSRSHSVTVVQCTCTNMSTNTTTTSKLYLVDLAGSERLKRTGTSGDREKESVLINKSLSALGDVFSALSQKSLHVPYRNSKLTSLLQDSLNNENGSKVLMLVNINPCVESAPESLCSLNFATRARQIELEKNKKVISCK
ncbi:kinesin motor domain mosaic protein [Acrasis kona]|uniref:Kinesin-like protein n=1 Tax=Acrasis kona TaxID=1008807 RepID=A0AAW2YX73_9EUKA